MPKAHRVDPGRKLVLEKIDPGDTGPYEKGPKTEALMAQHLASLYELQARFAADERYALLIVLQGLDAAGKDGTIRHVFSGVNPQGCEVDSFKVPTPLELSHDYLWRIHQQTPRKGLIEIFNRSHYEDVIAVRVEKLLPPEIWKMRFDHINQFEKMLVDCGTVILKFYLHISNREQKDRLQRRLDDPERNWKFSPSDLDVRGKWKAYREAYNEVLTRCNTPWAPWHVVPADRKWYRNLVVARTVVDTLEKLNPKFPKPKADLSKVVIK
jgi:PPK2 family polyphosphate:nucleotide phosphotransferase